MKGLEPSTFCMASRRSSQLSYIRDGAGTIAAPDTAERRAPPCGSRPRASNASPARVTRRARPALGLATRRARGTPSGSRPSPCGGSRSARSALAPFAVHHLVPVAVPLHRPRIVDGDRMRLRVEVVARIAAVLEHVAHDPVRFAGGELRIVHEATLGALPVVGEPGTGVLGQRTDVETRRGPSPARKVALGRPARAGRADRAVVLRPELVAKTRAPPRPHVRLRNKRDDDDRHAATMRTHQIVSIRISSSVVPGQEGTLRPGPANGRSAVERGERPRRARHGGACARLTALTTARSDAVTMLGWMPTPQSASSSTSAST